VTEDQSSHPTRRHTPRPTHGYTKGGKAVHGKTIDHLPTDTAYARFNKKFATFLTEKVGTMTCFYIFCLLALCSLPAILSEFSAFHDVFPSWMTAASLIALIAWLSSNFLQLVLLPALMVGQNLQSDAADARAAKNFEDTEASKNDIEKVLGLLDYHTEGGLKVLADAIAELSKRLPEPSGS
jgi:hypothetical protein